MSRKLLGRLAFRLALATGGVALVTVVALRVIPHNPTTVGFAYLLTVLAIASTWGFVESCWCSILATLTFNFFFFPPVDTFTIADPQNWVALFSFLATSLVASRLSDQAKKRAQDAEERQKDLERLYTFSRAILLIDYSAPFSKRIAQKLAETFGLAAAVLYDRRTGEIHRAGPSDFEGLDDQLRETASTGGSFRDASGGHLITAVRLGSQPIGALGVRGVPLHDSVLQGVANLVAIGLERARAQDLAHQVEAARQSEQMRTTLIDAMAHEFKTPLTSIKAATTSLLASPEQTLESRTELLRVANEEANRLQELIDNAVELARLDTSQLDLQTEPSDLAKLIREVVAAMHNQIDDRQVSVDVESGLPVLALDRRLIRIAVQQLLDNALKYSPAGTPVSIGVRHTDGAVQLEVSNQGTGIPPEEQARVFERFYRSPTIQQQIPGSGLGLSIAHRIAKAHCGDLTLTSSPGQTTFQMVLAPDRQGVAAGRESR